MTESELIQLLAEAVAQNSFTANQESYREDAADLADEGVTERWFVLTSEEHLYNTVEHISEDLLDAVTKRYKELVAAKYPR